MILYLWTNTLKRWLENPTAPLSKSIICLILSFAGLCILALISHLEKKISDKLNQSDILTVIITENAPKSQASTKQEIIENEFQSWTTQIPNSNLVFKSHQIATKGNLSIPVFFIHSDSNQQEKFTNTSSHPFVYVKPQPRVVNSFVEIEFQKTYYYAPVLQGVPIFDGKRKQESYLISSPSFWNDMGNNGFTAYSIYTLQNPQEVLRFVKNIGSYFEIENRNTLINSSANIIIEIQKILTIQKAARIVILILIALMLSIVMGNIQWLEYRQEIYLNALMRSFGVSPFLLYLHSMIENFLLSLFGFASALFLLNFLSKNLSSMSLSFEDSVRLENFFIQKPDVITLFVALIISSVLASIPVALGMKKPVGVILS